MCDIYKLNAPLDDVDHLLVYCNWKQPYDFCIFLLFAKSMFCDY